jgi:hypothetical protein
MQRDFDFNIDMLTMGRLYVQQQAALHIFVDSDNRKL